MDTDQALLETPDTFKFILGPDAPNRGPDMDAPIAEMAQMPPEDTVPVKDFTTVYLTNSIISSICFFAFDKFLLGGALGPKKSLIIGAGIPFAVDLRLNLATYRFLSLAHAKTVLDKPDPVTRRIMNPNNLRPMNMILPWFH